MRSEGCAWEHSGEGDPSQAGPSGCTHPKPRLHHATPSKPSSTGMKNSPGPLGAAILDWCSGHVGSPHVIPGQAFGCFQVPRT